MKNSPIQIHVIDGSAVRHKRLTERLGSDSSISRQNIRPLLLEMLTLDVATPMELMFIVAPISGNEHDFKPALAEPRSLV
jgi:hypothetical protein